MPQLINIQSILDLMKATLMVAFNSNKPVVIDAVNGYLADGEKRLTHLANGMLSGELDYKFVVKRLAEEKVTIIDQLLSIEQIVAADIQDLANRIVGIFRTAVDDAISQVESA